MRIFGIAIACLLFFESLLAQPRLGSITGRVSDLQTNEALIGANVVLRKAVGENLVPYGAPTDVLGKFIIRDVSPGVYTLRVTYIAYQPFETEPFKVSADSTHILDIHLDPYIGLTAQEAREDIKKGVIRIYMWGGMIGPSKAHADLAKEYGFEIGNTGCIPLQTARYDSVMVQYLASRNGKDWFDRFLSEWNKIKWP